jgi:hypothetical protein
MSARNIDIGRTSPNLGPMEKGGEDQTKEDSEEASQHLKRRSTTTLNGATSQKAVTFILAAVRT